MLFFSLVMDMVNLGYTYLVTVIVLPSILNLTLPVVCMRSNTVDIFLALETAPLKVSYFG